MLRRSDHLIHGRYNHNGGGKLMEAAAKLSSVTADEADPIFGIEIHGLDPIPAEHRHGKPISLLWMWLGGGFNYITLVTGGLAIIFGLSLTEAIIAVIVGSAVGSLVPGLISIIGPRTATATIVNTRAPFGLNGNFPSALISWASASGWVAVNSVLATFALVQLAGQAGLTADWVKGASLVVVLLGQVAIALYGHATVVAAERIFFVVSTVLLFGLMAFALPHVQWNHPAGNLIVSSEAGSFMLALSVFFASMISWVNYAADYTRYYPENTPRGKLVLWTSLGIGLASIVGGVMGSLLATAVDMSNPIANLPKVLPEWYLVPFLIAVIWGAVANNVLNLYTAGLGLIALRILVPRWIAVALVGALATVLTFYAVFVYDFTSLYAGWLSLTIILLSPWAAILLVDYYVRKGRYDSAALHTWGKGAYWYNGGVNWPALGIYVVGAVAAMMFASSTLWTGPLVKYVGGADLSIFTGLIVTGVLYYFLAVRQIGQSSVAAGAAS
jgi:nucleobase:cation symporter-1, NCS1 family